MPTSKEKTVFVLELAFDDNPQRLAARAAHRERLERLHDDGALRMAGPFADDSGALLLFDVPDLAGLETLMDDDPYYRAPGVTIVRRTEWAPVFT